MTDLVNCRFGRLVVSEINSCRLIVSCACDCGGSKTVRRYDLLNGRTRSCGCLHREAVIARNKATATRGGATHSYTGKSWNAVISRCYNKKYHCYASYGAIGIVACEFIRASPLNLIVLIGERPHGCSIDRVNNNGSYTCGQCAECHQNGWPKNIRWATATEQGRNQRTNHLITIDGQTKCLAEWADFAGLSQSVIALRIKRGWPIEKLLIPRLKPGVFIKGGRWK